MGGDSLVGQWLGHDTFTAMAQVQSLVWKLRFRKLHSVVKNKTKQKNTMMRCI